MTGGRMSTQAGGPYLQAALFCERVLQENDGVLTIVRVIDRFTVQVRGPQASDALPPVPIGFTAVIILKTGSFEGKYKLTLTPVTPTKKELPAASVDLLLEGGEDRGVNAILPVQMLANEEGVYWFEVKLAGQILTKIPLRLIYQTVSQSPPMAT